MNNNKSTPFSLLKCKSTIVSDAPVVLNKNNNNNNNNNAFGILTLETDSVSIKDPSKYTRSAKK